MKIFEYTDGDTVFEGKFFKNQNAKDKLPCVLVAHAWDGPNSYFDDLAKQFSIKNAHAFAIDVYGKGVRGKIDGDNSHLMDPLMKDRGLLHKRILASLDAVKSIDCVDSDSIYALGFCFGGVCVLDLARLNPSGLVKVAAVHSGLEQPAEPILKHQISAKVLLLNGYEDPVAKPGQLVRFFDEMTEKQADWNARVYGNTKHAFTFEGANIPDLGIEYNKEAASDAFLAIDEFFQV